MEKGKLNGLRFWNKKGGGSLIQGYSCTFPEIDNEMLSQPEVLSIWYLNKLFIDCTTSQPRMAECNDNGVCCLCVDVYGTEWPMILPETWYGHNLERVNAHGVVDRVTHGSSSQVEIASSPEINTTFTRQVTRQEGGMRAGLGEKRIRT